MDMDDILDVLLNEEMVPMTDDEYGTPMMDLIQEFASEQTDETFQQAET